MQMQMNPTAPFNATLRAQGSTQNPARLQQSIPLTASQAPDQVNFSAVRSVRFGAEDTNSTTTEKNTTTNKTHHPNWKNSWKTYVGGAVALVGAGAAVAAGLAAASMIALPVASAAILPIVAVGILAAGAGGWLLYDAVSKSEKKIEETTTEKKKTEQPAS